jgi:6,7-dimethyl-8-ribityllumazine synthase
MKTFLEFKGQSLPQDRYALIAGRWHSPIVDGLIQGAQDYLIHTGGQASQLDVFRVPGSFEIPQAAQWIIKEERHAGLLLLGCIVQGDTPHFDVLTHSVMQAVQTLALEGPLPLTCGILTVQTLEQAEARAQKNENNKGWEAMSALLEMIQVKRDGRMYGH